MMSDRHKPDRPRGPEDALLDAAREVILAVGWKRSTLTSVARRAGVSRMTIYRAWPDMASLLADLLTRELSALVPALVPATPAQLTADALGATVARMVAAVRENDLFRKIVEVDPELLLPYLLDRRGRSQDLVLGLLEAGISQGQRDHDVRPGDSALMARAVLLAAHGFALSAPTMTATPDGSVAALDSALHDLVARYLRP